MKEGSQRIQVVVLMGGVGSRLGSITAQVPKPMVDVNGRPFFAYMLDVLKRQGFTDFLFLTGYRTGQIEEYFGDGGTFGVTIAYSRDGQKLLGTGGALRRALPLLKDEFLLVYGDSFMDIDYNELVLQQRHFRLTENKPLLLAVYENRNRLDSSNVVFKDGRLLAYDKKTRTADMDYIDYGAAVLTREAIAELPADEGVDLGDFYHRAVADGRMAGAEVRTRFYEIGRPESLQEFRDFMAGRLGRKHPAIFLDRDGTLNELVFNEDAEQMDSPMSVEQFRLLPGVTEALAALQSLGYLLIVVTNQPAAAKGKASLADLYRINLHMDRLLRQQGVRLDDIVTCPHHPVGDRRRCLNESLIGPCLCRKPGGQMIRRSIEKFNIDPGASFLVGDSPVDVQAARSQNVPSVFVGGFKCDACRLLGQQKPDLLVEDLGAFARHLQGNTQP